MRTRIRKWGNSLGVRIPSALAEDAHLHEGAEVDVSIREGQLVIVPVLSLAELVSGITAANLPALDVDDAPRGGELW
ncbi:MAG: AbrB/MazE/SpoVT family DNA-binding domain-containing protein [Gemmatimonadaceae bacterium]|nr:AbrB/MazE/SpoVT family DNA-binding domain-containing protein [Gemmatimonadaceae bacterium]